MSMVATIVFSLEARVGSGIIFALIRGHFILFKRDSHWQYLVTM